MFNQILVVCTGNICRSPMSVGILKQMLGQAGLDNIVVHSAGLDALTGQPADVMAEKQMSLHGIDISSHRARPLTHDLAMSSDLILVMEQEQKQYIESLEPTARGKVFRLGTWRNIDIPDPYRKTEEAFRNALTLIIECTEDWLPKLKGY